MCTIGYSDTLRMPMTLSLVMVDPPPMQNCCCWLEKEDKVASKPTE